MTAAATLQEVRDSPSPVGIMNALTVDVED